MCISMTVIARVIDAGVSLLQRGLLEFYPLCESKGRWERSMVKKMNEDMKLMSRTVTLQLSNNHCKDILKLCGERNLTVSQLLETFLKSLLGKSCAGEMASDVFCAQQWLKQYTLYNVPLDKSLLMFLYEENVEAEDFIQLYYNIAITEENISNMKIFGGCSAEEFRKEEAELKQYEAEFTDYKIRYLAVNPEANWEEEVEKVNLWSVGACHFQYPVDFCADDDDESEEGFL